MLQSEGFLQGFKVSLTLAGVTRGLPWVTRVAHLAALLLAELSAICELAIQRVSPTTVRACGRRPTSFTVIIRCRDDLRTCTASSWGTLRKLRPFTSRIWSPTCGGGRAERGGAAGGAEQGGKGGASWGRRHARGGSWGRVRVSEGGGRWRRSGVRRRRRVWRAMDQSGIIGVPQGGALETRLRLARVTQGEIMRRWRQSDGSV